jgi:nickel-type superoxide dismutase maturation protease
MREAGWKDRLLVVLGSGWAVRVSGDSMRPELEHDDILLVQRPSKLAVGDVVIAAHPFKESITVLKRIVGIEEDGRVELRGDDPDESSDSRSFGIIPRDHIRGKAVCRLKRAATE